MSYTQAYYHIVLRTKYREKSLPQQNISELYRYIWGIINNKKCQLLRINGVEDHIHILVNLHPAIALADLVRDIKVASNFWMRSRKNFSSFKGWGRRYAAFTCGHRDKDTLINYIINQQEHHKKECFKDEIIRIFREGGNGLDERFFIDS